MNYLNIGANKKMKDQVIVTALFFSLLIGCGETDDFNDVAYYHYKNATNYQVVIEKKVCDDVTRTNEISSKDSLLLPSSRKGVVPFMDDETDSSQVIVRFRSEPEKCFIYPENRRMENDIRFEDAYLLKDGEMHFSITDDMLESAGPCE